MHDNKQEPEGEERLVMYRNVSSRRVFRHAASRRRRRPAVRPFGSYRCRSQTSQKVIILSSFVVLAMLYSVAMRRVATSGTAVSPPADEHIGVKSPSRPLASPNRSEVPDDGERVALVSEDPEPTWEPGNWSADSRPQWKRIRGWESLSDEDLVEWAPLGPDPPGCLPRAPPDRNPLVMIGWGFGSTKLTLQSYRALESLLHVYPGASVRFITVGPRYAFYYKWANVMAKTQFQKYLKRGYDVEVEIYFGGSPAPIKQNGVNVPGADWWERHKDSVLFAKGMRMDEFQKREDALPMASTTLYLALLGLYKRGGMYVDLTTFFFRPLPRGVDGFVVGGEGRNTGSMATDTGTEEYSDCSLPTASGKRQRALVMQYSTPRHPVVACALLAFDDQRSALNQCLERSASDEYGGLDCVLTVLEMCTVKVDRKNDLRDAGVVEWHGCSETLAKSYSGSLRDASGAEVLERLAAVPPRLLPEPPKAAVEIVQSPVNASSGGEDSVAGGPAESAEPSEASLDNQGLAASSTTQGISAKEGDGRQQLPPEEGKAGSEEAVSGSKSPTDGGEGNEPRRWRRLHEFLGDEPIIRGSGESWSGFEAGRNDSISRSGGAMAVVTSEAGVDAAWVSRQGRGRSLVDGELAVERAADGVDVDEDRAKRVSLIWLGPEVSDGEWREPEEGSLWGEAFSRLRLTQWKPQQVSSSCRTSCSHWNVDSPPGSTSPEVAKRQASLQCAPIVFVPGTQKGASTFLFHAITYHPQVVQPLRGAHGFKETGRYVPRVAEGPENLGVRLAAFPFIEDHENFVTGDGTVTYMFQDAKTPSAVFADSPQAKIVFALRDPVARAWSDFRFLWGVYSSHASGFPGVIKDSLEVLQACFEDIAEDPEPVDVYGGGPGELKISAADEQGIHRIFTRCSSSKDPGQLIRKGLYYYQVLEWFKVFGRDNIMVVDSADLQSRQQETIEEIYRFLGLCPTDLSKLEPENVTREPNIPSQKRINASAFQALQDFYAPFNKKLYQLLGRDLGWEENKFKEPR